MIGVTSIVMTAVAAGLGGAITSALSTALMNLGRTVVTGGGEDE